jgi:hypothetical protein
MLMGEFIILMQHGSAREGDRVPNALSMPSHVTFEQVKGFARPQSTSWSPPSRPTAPASRRRSWSSGGGSRDQQQRDEGRDQEPADLR